MLGNDSYEYKYYDETFIAGEKCSAPIIFGLAGLVCFGCAGIMKTIVETDLSNKFRLADIYEKQRRVGAHKPIGDKCPVNWQW